MRENGRENSRKPIQLDFSIAFQLKYSLMAVASYFLTSLVFFIYVNEGLGDNYFESLTTLRNLEQALPFSLIITFIAQIILILLLTVAINLFISHKIGGPVYRFEHSLENILKGDLRYAVQTRKGDQLKSMVRSLNDLQVSMRRVFIRCHRLHNLLDGSLHKQAIDFGAVQSMIGEVRQSMGGYFTEERMKDS